jgi:hypothetical protein
VDRFRRPLRIAFVSHFSDFLKFKFFCFRQGGSISREKGSSVVASNTSNVASASSFVNSIAVNTHAGFGWDGYDNIRVVTQALNYLGVTTLRDSLGISPESDQLVKALADSGFKFDLTVSSLVPSQGQQGGQHPGV